MATRSRRGGLIRDDEGQSIPLSLSLDLTRLFPPSRRHQRSDELLVGCG